MAAQYGLSQTLRTISRPSPALRFPWTTSAARTQFTATSSVQADDAGPSSSSSSSNKPSWSSRNKFNNRQPSSNKAVENTVNLKPPFYTHILHIHANRRNTLATLTKPDGQTITIATAGMAGFKGAPRGTQDAGMATGKLLVERAQKAGIQVPEGKQNGGLWIKLRGFGPGRDAVVRSLIEHNWKIVRMQDTTPIPWGGDRPKKAKRR